MTAERAELRGDTRYQALVSAASRDEAVEIASEAVPASQRVAKAEVEDVSSVEGPGSYRVTLWLAGEARRGPEGD